MSGIEEAFWRFAVQSNLLGFYFESPHGLSKRRDDKYFEALSY